MEEGGKPVELAVCHGSRSGGWRGVEGVSVRVWRWSRWRGHAGVGQVGWVCTGKAWPGVAECMYMECKEEERGEESALWPAASCLVRSRNKEKPAAANSRGLLSEARAVQEKENECNLRHKAPRKWLQ